MLVFRKILRTYLMDDPFPGGFVAKIISREIFFFLGRWVGGFFSEEFFLKTM